MFGSLKRQPVCPRHVTVNEMRSQVLGLLLAGLGLGLGLAQNPFENLALGAMSVAANIAEAVQGGAAINRDLNIDNPLMSVHSKTAAGFGDAMRPPSGDDSSESESKSGERGRRRRRRSLQRSRRIKRAPCHWMMSMATATPGEDEVEARKKRARKRAANNASRSRINAKKSGKKKLLRRRRQQPMEGQQQQQQAAGTLGDRIKGMWLSFVDSVADVVQQVRQKISSAAGAAAGGAN